MRVLCFGVVAACFWLSPASGQQPPDSQGQESFAPADQSQPANGRRASEPKLLPGERPQTAEELRQKQIDAHDPLAKDPAVKDANQSAQSPGRETAPQQTAPAPLPGSIAESNQTPAARSEGPQIVSGDDVPLDPQYNGPAVLSRSYTLTRPMSPKQIKWSWSIGGGGSYATGLLAPSSTAGGGFTTVDSPGANATWSFKGRHMWKRDQIGVNYSGTYNQYANAATYTGSNQILNLDYEHQFSPHIVFNIVESASIFSQNGTLLNPATEPGVSIANISLAESPTVQLLDLTTRQSTTQVGITWRKTTRLSFSYSGSLFGVQRTGSQLFGDSGYQAQSDVNYRITRKTTIGAYYAYVAYTFAHHYADSGTNTVGLIYSYAPVRTLQLRTRAGVSRIESQGLTVIQVSPVIAVLTGQTAAIVDSYRRSYISDISGEIVKDFGSRRTANLSYAHGVSPGNGAILSSTQQVVSGAYNMLLLRRYAVGFAIGQSRLSATLQAVGKYTSNYGSMTVSRNLTENLVANFAMTYRTVDTTNFAKVQSQLVVSSGLSWGPGEGKLW